MSDIVFLTNVRLSFPHLIEAHAPKGSAPTVVKTYSGDAILTPDHPKWKEFMEKVMQLATAKWKEHAPAVMQMIQNDRKQRCYGSGADKIDKKTFKPYSGYEGNFYISAKSERPPQMVDSNGKVVESTMEQQAIARTLYGGCYVNMAVKPWIQANDHGNGVRCELIAIQFAKDGEPFGEGSADVTGMFGAVEGASAPQAPAIQMPGLPSFLG